MRSASSRSRLGVVVALEVVAVYVSHRFAGPGVDFAHPLEWSRDVAPGEAVIALARIALAVVGWWLLGTTVAYFLARATRARWLAAATERLTLPAVRRVVDAAVVLTLVGSGLSARPAVAVVAGRPTIAIAAEPNGPGPARGSHAYVPVAAGDGRRAPPRRDASAGRAVRTPVARGEGPSSPAPAPAGQRPPEVIPASPPVAASTYEIVRGDNFWTIAARRVRAEHPGASNAEVARYWMRLVGANGARIRSGDPNLIFPGERVVLPAIDS